MSFSKHMAKNSHKNMKRTASMFFSIIDTILTDRSRRHRHKKSTIADKKGLAKGILKNTARTVDDIRYNIEKSVVDYTSAPEEHVIETDEDVIVHLDLSGVKKEDIELKITELSLKVEANLDIRQRIEKGNSIFINDRKSGVFKRSIRFPNKIVPEEAEATFKNGILTVEAPKADKKGSFSVEVK